MLYPGIIVKSEQYLLQNLAPLRNPDPVSMFPAPGWIALSLILLAAFAWMMWVLARDMGRETSSPGVLIAREIHEMMDQGTLSFAQLNQCLKRVAIAHFPREQVASLSGVAWLKFLISNSKNIAAEWLDPVVHHYDQHREEPSRKHAHACIEWIRQIDMEIKT